MAIDQNEIRVESYEKRGYEGGEAVPAKRLNPGPRERNRQDACYQDNKAADHRISGTCLDQSRHYIEVERPRVGVVTSERPDLPIGDLVGERRLLHLIECRRDYIPIWQSD